MAADARFRRNNMISLILKLFTKWTKNEMQENHTSTMETEMESWERAVHTLHFANFRYDILRCHILFQGEKKAILCEIKTTRE